MDRQGQMDGSRNRWSIPRMARMASCVSLGCQLRFPSMCGPVFERSMCTSTAARILRRQPAYSAAAYWRVELVGRITTAFVLGKCRVVPQTAKLELQAAVLGAKVAQIMKHAHKVPIESVWLWTDSKTVFQWLQRQENENTADTYVINRIYTILQGSERGQWHWVPGKENPAEIGTRTDQPPELWRQGPEFLRLGSSQWPTLRLEVPTEKAINFVCPAAPEKTNLINHERFSSFVKARRVVGLALRAVEQFKRQKPPCTRRQKVLLKALHALPASEKVRIIPAFTALEIKSAEKFMIIVAQTSSYGIELANLQRGLPLSRTSRILALNPRLGEDKVMRLGGRIEKATWIPFETRNAAILPREAPFFKYPNRKALSCPFLTLEPGCHCRGH